jgi:hypothetical protein
VRHQLNYIKWILLVFVIMEIVSLLVAFIMRCCVDPDGHYGDFADEEVRDYGDHVYIHNHRDATLLQHYPAAALSVKTSVELPIVAGLEHA